MKKIVVLVCLAALALMPILVGYESKAAEQPVLKIGAPMSLSGPISPTTNTYRVAQLMAQEQINAEGGILGRKVQCIFRDDEGKPEVALAAAKKLIYDDKVSLLVSGTNSDPSLAIQPLAESVPIIWLNACAAHPKIATGTKYTFRLAPAIPQMADGYYPVLKRELNLKPTDTIFCLVGNTEYSRNGSGAFKAKVQADPTGPKIMGTEIYDTTITDLTPLLTKVNGMKPTYIYSDNNATVSQMAMWKAYHTVGCKIPVLTSAGGLFTDVIAALGDYMEGTMSTDVWISNDPRPESQKFTNEFVKRTQLKPSAYQLYCYEAMFVIKQALEMAGTPDNVEAIAKALMKVEYKGLVDVKFNADHNNAAIKYGVVSVHNKQIVVGR